MGPNQADSRHFHAKHPSNCNITGQSSIWVSGPAVLVGYESGISGGLDPGLFFSGLLDQDLFFWSVESGCFFWSDISGSGFSGLIYPALVFLV